VAPLLRLFKKHTGIRYLFVGGTSYVFELSALLLTYHLTGSKAWAAAVAFLVGFCIAFVLQKLVAFQEFSKEMKALSRQWGLYILLNAWNYAFTVAFVSVFPAKHLVLSRTVALVMMSAWNYVIYRKIIFRKRVKDPI
jgi:putative flippase GtrA